MIDDNFIRAFKFAALAHGSQKRKGTNTPYIAHPMAVASLVLEHGGSLEVVCSALLHDVIEDCNVKPEKVSETFGMRVLELVQAVTNPPIDWKMFKSDEELQHTLMAFRMVMFEKLRDADADVQLLSACDKLHNARGILEDLHRVERYNADGIAAIWNRFRGKRMGTLWYYVELSKVYRDSESAQVKHLGRELELVCDELGRF